MKPRTPPRAPDAGPMPSPFTPPPPKRIYNIVEPSTLARVYAAAYASGSQDQIGRARAAVYDFIALMREDFE